MGENTAATMTHQENERKKDVENHVLEENNSEESLLLDTAAESTKSFWKSTTLRQKLLLLDIIFIVFTVNAIEIISAPFFSRVVVQKGGTVFYSALILGMVTATYTVASPILGIYQRKIGMRRIFYSGLVLSGICQICFGFLEFVDDIKVFVALGVILKGICGIGVAGTNLAVYNAIVTEYTGHISQVYSFFITSIGCGRFVGPAYGGYMYDRYGMCTTIVIWGAIPIVSIPLHCFLYKPENKRTESDQYDLMSFIRKPSSIAIFFLIFMTCGIFAYTDVALTIYLETVGLSVSLVGVAILTIGFCLALSGPVYGYLAGNKSWLAFVFIIVGSICFSATLFIFSPNQTVPLIYTGCALFGIFGSAVNVPLFEYLLISANGGPITSETNTSLHTALSGVWNAFIGAGFTLVPAVFSAIQTAAKTTVSNMFYAQAGIVLFISVFLFLSKMKENKKCYNCLTTSSDS